MNSLWGLIVCFEEFVLIAVSCCDWPTEPYPTRGLAFSFAIILLCVIFGKIVLEFDLIMFSAIGTDCSRKFWLIRLDSSNDFL